MQQITNSIATMTSLELVAFINEERAELVRTGGAAKFIELAHRSFLAKVPEVLGSGSAKFLADYQHEQNGQTYPMYRLPKREACLMAMSYSYELQAKVFDKMTQLEAAVAAPTFSIPTTLSGALRLAAEQAEVIEAQAAQLAVAAPSVEFVEKYADATGTKGFRQVAKLLRVKENVFREFLIENKIMYRLGAELTPMAQHIDAGRFVVKAGKSDGGHAYNAARFTTKGITWIAGEYAKHQVAQHH